MRIKYANPYFKNENMNNKMMDFLDKRKPKLSSNPNINQFEDDKLSIPTKTSVT